MELLRILAILIFRLRLLNCNLATQIRIASLGTLSYLFKIVSRDSHLLIGSLALLIGSLTPVRLLLLNLLDTVVGEKFLPAHILRDKECRPVRLLFLLMMIGEILLGFGARKPHLGVTRRCEHVFGLGLSGQLLGENLTLYIRIRSNVRNGQSDTFSHDFGVQVVPLDLLLHFAGEELDRVRVGPVRLLVRFALHVALVVDQVVVVDDHCGQILGQLVLQVCVAWRASGLLGERVAGDVDDVDGASERQVPQALLAVDHVERDVHLLQLLEVVALVEHLRVELEELVAGEIQPLEPLDGPERLEDDGGAAD